MIKPLFNSSAGPLRVLGVCSGPGPAIWSALDLQNEMKAQPGGCPFELVGLFSDRPASPALAEADRRSLPKYLLDAEPYHNGPAGELMSPDDNKAFEADMIELMAPLKADCLLVSGYQWTIGPKLLDKYLGLRVWPGGPACVKGFLKTGDKNLRAKVTFLTAPGGVGPVMIVAPSLNIDYGRFEDEKGGVSIYLASAMEQSGLAGARAVLELARGHFGSAESGDLYYKGQIIPDGLVFDSWRWTFGGG